MARKKRAARASAPAAIVVRQSAPMARRRSSRSSPRVIVARAPKRRRRGGGGSGGPSRFVGDMIGIAAGAALGWATKADKLPERFGPVDSPVAIAVGAMLIPMVVKGKVGKIIGDMGAGVGAVAAYRVTQGTKVWVSEGEWEDDE